jgi:hypothetical protein
MDDEAEDVRSFCQARQPLSPFPLAQGGPAIDTAAVAGRRGTTAAATAVWTRQRWPDSGVDPAASVEC